MTARRNSIPIWRKQEVITWILEEGNGVPPRAVKHFRLNVDGTTIRKWWRNREQIMAAKPNQRRVSGGGRKPLCENMEDMLYDLIIDKRLRKEKVTREWIANQAVAVYASLHAEKDAAAPFSASQHWVSNFMARYALSLRRRTNLMTLTTDTLVSRAVSYMRYLHDLLPKMDRDRTILMDETAVYFEDARTQTVDVLGARHIVLRSTGYASMRITVILAVTASGRKLPPVLIWKGKDTLVFEKIGGMYVTKQKRAWVDSGLLKRWIDLQFPLVDGGDGKFLVWDSMRAHISRELKAKCEARRVGMCVIPGGLTPYLQVGDIAIYRAFKDILCGEINAWKESGDVQYTKAGNPRPPAVEVVCDWIRRSWAATECETVFNSITAAGFSNNPYDWFIARHDVNAEPFMEKWESKAETEADAFNMTEFDDALDDITLLHEEDED
ncbi:unnamed protein product [Phytophthora lilii]|uniref:Unnamed protein product n=1 Tax=Phytophthora lilii TaxID=2077276 RepID=A0A9W6TVV9_9STRA|nr:unnamed protein product [Phytophthora lilii]